MSENELSELYVVRMVDCGVCEGTGIFGPSRCPGMVCDNGKVESGKVPLSQVLRQAMAAELAKMGYTPPGKKSAMPDADTCPHCFGSTTVLGIDRDVDCPHCDKNGKRLVATGNQAGVTAVDSEWVERQEQLKDYEATVRDASQGLY